MTTVIKVSGHELDDPAFLTQFASAVCALNTPTVIVHGGGKEITALQQLMGVEPRYVDGLRITDAVSLSVVEMVLCGVVNKRLVAHLLRAGVDALGLSGVDRQLVRAEKMTYPEQDMGFTGSVIGVRSEVLQGLLTMNITPVIAPVCYGEDSNYNVNADHVAGAIAAALGAERLIFLSNVTGVLDGDQLVPTLTRRQADDMIRTGLIFGGMIPKVRTALEALDMGVRATVITNLAGLQSGSGTVFTRG